MNLETSLYSLLSFAWTLTRPTNYSGQYIVFSCSEIIPVSFSFFSLFSVSFFFIIYFTLLLTFTKIILLLLYYYNFFLKIIGCSGMFRNVLCSWFYRRPTDNVWHVLLGKRYICKQNPCWTKFSFTIFITYTSPKPSQAGLLFFDPI